MSQIAFPLGVNVIPHAWGTMLNLAAAAHFLSATFQEPGRAENDGPILPVIRFSDRDDELALANDTPYGLAAYVFTTDLSRGLRAAAGIDAGSVCVNEPHYDVSLPHGGVKQSGVDRDCSHASLEEYLTLKRVSVLM